MTNYLHPVVFFYQISFCNQRKYHTIKKQNQTEYGKDNDKSRENNRGSF
jgi:hypothetical protein